MVERERAVLRVRGRSKEGQGGGRGTFEAQQPLLRDLFPALVSPMKNASESSLEGSPIDGKERCREVHQKNRRENQERNEKAHNQTTRVETRGEEEAATREREKK